MSAQQPVQTELLMRYHQLQSRLATLRIENEEVRVHTSLRGLKLAGVSDSFQNEASSHAAALYTEILFSADS